MALLISVDPNLEEGPSPTSLHLSSIQTSKASSSFRKHTLRPVPLHPHPLASRPFARLLEQRRSPRPISTHHSSGAETVNTPPRHACSPSGVPPSSSPAANGSTSNPDLPCQQLHCKSLS